MRNACPPTLLSLVVLTSLGVVACSGGGRGTDGPNAQSPERQSDAEYDLARDLYQKGNPRAALDHVQKAIAFNDENEKAQYLSAAIYLSFCSTNRGYSAPDCNLSQVEKHARGALKANPQFRDGINMLGSVLTEEKKYKEAISVLEPLTKDAAYLYPFFAWGNLGWAQVQDGQLDAGIASLKNAVTEPRFCVGHYHLGVAYERKNDLTGAEEAFTNAVTVSDPQCENLQDAWEGRARVRLRRGKTAEARTDYERCREISSETQTGKTCIQKLATLPGAPSAPSAAPAAAGKPHAAHGSTHSLTRRT